ncbi:MAG: ABC transporter ATP-binding protein, partial [Caldilineaceae bacterium]|nr:ABC transporter ATP-binding protein [Caldilineaceae bacterium]
LFTIATLDLKLLLVPLIFLAALVVTLRRHNEHLRPVAGLLRERFGAMNAGLAEAVAGIEVVKGFAQEPAEEGRFQEDARAYRDAFVQEGDINARYLPLLLYGLAIGLAFGHALLLFRQGDISVGQVITYMALIGTLRSPIRFLLRTSSVIQQSLAGARRILETILTETELDQNTAGLSQAMQGDVQFEHVSFGYEAVAGAEAGNGEMGGNGRGPVVDGAAALVLNDISFHVKPGRTVAIVGQTGAGKSTLTKLLNRTFDT